jgi:MFS family permease
LIGSSYFIGWVATLLILPALADYLGRKWIYRSSMVITFALYIGIYLCHSANGMIAINFCLGALTTARISVCFVYMLEFVRVKHQSAVGSAWSIIDGFTYFFITLYFQVIWSYWIPITLIGVLEITYGLGVCFYIPESPKFLIN